MGSKSESLPINTPYPFPHKPSSFMFLRTITHSPRQPSALKQAEHNLLKFVGWNRLSVFWDAGGQDMCLES